MILSQLATKPHPAPCLLTPSGMGENPKGRSEKTLRNKDSYTGKAKAMNASRTEQGIHPPLRVGTQFFSHSQESKAPSGVTATWEDKGHHSKGVSPFLLLQIFEHTVI